MARDDAKRLRAQVQRKLKSVENKIKRTQRTSGANIAGTQFDPRRSAGIENRYNARQLKTYLDQLSNFMRRTNQFVAGDNGAPLPRGKFNLYKKAEAEWNAAGKAHAESVNSLKVPSGYTIEQSKNLVVESHASSVYGPYRQYNRAPQQIKDINALEKLTDQMNKGTRESFLKEKIEDGRENLRKALEKMEEPELQAGVDQLTDYQFDALWFGTNFAEATFLKYQAEKDRLAGKPKEEWQDRIIDSAYSELGDLLEWAGNEVPPERPNINTKKPRKRR